MIDYSALPSKVRGRYLAKPTEFGPSLLILKRDRVCSLLQAPPFHGIIKNSLFFRNSHILTGAGSPAGAHSMIGLGTIVNTIAIVAGGLGGWSPGDF